MSDDDYMQAYWDGYNDGYKDATTECHDQMRQLRDALRAILDNGEAPEQATKAGNRGQPA